LLRMDRWIGGAIHPHRDDMGACHMCYETRLSLQPVSDP
jgi:hypothetical protein